MPDDYVWALKDINLEVEEGEVLGIIGKNGAGKSTLLKILSKVTSPTTGTIKARGRIASLLEIGTGFHQEMTGRENIFLNGAILGMTKAEIQKKFDEIVDFAGVERYIDTPVKRYSSGMMVRLGFAVAAHLDPEILVVDEVLAVGDAEFQKKAIGKMHDVSRNEGRTVLFVSHNMTAIENLCRNVCILQHGKMDFLGNNNEAVIKYLKESNPLVKSCGNLTFEDEIFRLLNFTVKQNEIDDNFISNIPINVIISYNVKKEVFGLRIGFELIDDNSGIVIFRTFHDENEEVIFSTQVSKYTSNGQIPGKLLKEGSYVVYLAIGIHNQRWITKDTIGIRFFVHNIGGINKNYADDRNGIIMPFINWVTTRN
jgi:lipopolysaccharide transport system ATP-binding protein